MICAFWDDLAGGDGLHLARQRQPPLHRAVGRLRAAYVRPQHLQRQLHLRDHPLRPRLPRHRHRRRPDRRCSTRRSPSTATRPPTSPSGIQNAARDVGLTYAYGNHYAGGAATIQAGRAIRFVPVVPQAQGILHRRGDQRLGRRQRRSPAPWSPCVGNGRTLASGADGIYAGGVPVGTWDVAVYHPSCAPDTTYDVVDQRGPDHRGRLLPRRHRRPRHRQHHPAGRHRGHRRPLRGGGQRHRPDRRGRATRCYYTSSATGGPSRAAAEPDRRRHRPGARPRSPASPTAPGCSTGSPPATCWATVSADPAARRGPRYCFMVAAVTEVVDDDCEAAGGWIVEPRRQRHGAPRGIWEHGDPIGTVAATASRSSPRTTTPRRRASNCWFTGQHVAGQSVGLQRRRRRRHHPRLSPVYNVAGLGTGLGELLALVHQRPGQQPGRGHLAGAGVQRRRHAPGPTVENTTASNNAWQQMSFVLNDLLRQPDQLQLRFVASDDGTRLAGRGGRRRPDHRRRHLGGRPARRRRCRCRARRRRAPTPTADPDRRPGPPADDVGVVHARVWLSPGRRRELRPAARSRAPSTASCDWTVDVPADQSSYSARVRVEVLDGSSGWPRPTSPTLFTIEPGTTDVPVSPSGRWPWRRTTPTRSTRRR